MAQALGDEQRLARVYTYLVNYYYLKGEPDLAIEYGERCLRIGEAVQDRSLQALARGYLGYSYHAQGKFQEAERVLRQNLEALGGAPTDRRDHPEPHLVRDVGGVGGVHLCRPGRF